MTKEGTEDKRQAGVSESVKAAVPPSLLGALRGVEAQAEETFARPADTKPLELREAALQWLADATPHAVFTPDAPALTLVSARDEQLEALAAEHAQYKIEKGAALAKVAALLATATDPDDIRALKDLMEQIGDAKTLSAIHAITANLPAAITVAVSKDGQGNQPGDLYASDAEYRAASDRNRIEGQKLDRDLAEKLQPADEMAKKLGHSTTQDERIKDLDSLIEAADKDRSDPSKVHLLRVQKTIALGQQNEERLAKARAENNPEAIRLYETARDEHIKEGREGAEAVYRKETDDYLKALGRQLKNNGLSPKDIEERINAETARREKVLLDAKDPNQILSFSKIIRKDRNTLEDYLANNSSNYAAPINQQPNQATTLLAPALNGIETRLEAVEAPKEQLATLSQPAHVKNDTPVRGL